MLAELDASLLKSAAAGFDQGHATLDLEELFGSGDFLPGGAFRNDARNTSVSYDLDLEAKVDDPSQSARAFYVSSSEPKD